MSKAMKLRGGNESQMLHGCKMAKSDVKTQQFAGDKKREEL